MSLKEKIEILQKKLPIFKSFDILGREIEICNRKAYYIFVDGFAKDDILYYFLENVQKIDTDFKSLDEFLKRDVAYIEAEEIKEDLNFDKIATYVLSGMFALVFEDFDSYILLDTREYPVRSITESEVEKVVRGSRDSFVETIVYNTALIRRRIRVPNLIFEINQVGETAKTDIAISYIEGIVDEKVLQNIKIKLKSIDTNALILGSEYIEEFLFDKKWFNPLPMVKYTERPDVAASYLAEGHIALIIDTSPIAIILPVNMFTFTQHIGDYNMKPLSGTLIRFFRFWSILVATFLAPVFVYLSDDTKYLKTILDKASESSDSKEAMLSFFLQILILEIVFLILQTSAIHIPEQIAPMISIIGGLMLGDIAIKAGAFSSGALLVMLLTVICTYKIPSIELTDALRIFRFFMVISVGIFSLKGLIGSILIVTTIIFTTSNIKGAKRYTYPLIPFNFKHLKNLFVRGYLNKIK